MVLDAIARDFARSRPEIALTLTASLAMRPLGALLFGIMADRHGRRLPLMLAIVFYSVVEMLSGLAPDYRTFLVLRLLFGVAMGGEWGVGASLAMESAPEKRRGVVSGLLQEGYALGYLLAAAVYFAVFPRYGWRAMFFIGGLPALLTLFVRARVKEPEAWHEHRSTDWAAYGRAITGHWQRFLYLVLLMTMMNFISHGTQDLYPTFLQGQRHFSPQATAAVTMVSMVGAIAGGLLFGMHSDRRGRRRAMITAMLGGALFVPLWVLAPTTPAIVVGAFCMQFMVQGAWGIIPAHLNELSPGALRGFFPGFAYQLGVLLASSITYVEALLGEHFSYAAAMGALAAGVLLGGAVVTWLGPEARGVSFRRGGHP